MSDKVEATYHGRRQLDDIRAAAEADTREAELRQEVARLTVTLNRVRELADEWSRSTGVASFVAIGAGLGQLLDGPAPADPDELQP